MGGDSLSEPVCCWEKVVAGEGVSVLESIFWSASSLSRNFPKRNAVMHLLDENNGSSDAGSTAWNICSVGLEMDVEVVIPHGTFEKSIVNLVVVDADDDNNGTGNRIGN